MYLPCRMRGWGMRVYRAAAMLADWEQSLKAFRQIVPVTATVAVEAAPAQPEEAPKTAA